MGIKITHDASAPTASIELMITRPLPDFDLLEVETRSPREIDPILASQGFKDLLDEARSVLDGALQARGLELVQLTGAICTDSGLHRPGLWLVLREAGATPNQAMSAAARTRVAKTAEELRARLALS